MPSLLSSSNLNLKITNRLIDPFNSMTTFFFRRSVEKAFQLDEAPADLSLNINKPLPSNAPYLTSAVDDVMYVVNNVLQRALATSQRAVVSSVVPTIARVLGSDFVGMIQRKMRDESYPKGAVQGALPPEDKIIAFLVLLNNLDVATDYTKRIVQSRIDSSSSEPMSGDSPSTPLTDLFPFDHDAVFVTNALRGLENSFQGKTFELIGDGINVVFGNVIKPRLRPILADAFRDVDYLLSSEDLASLSHGQDPDESIDGMPEDLVKDRFSQGWESLIRPFSRLLTARNFDKLLTTTVLYLSKLVEKRIWSYYGRANELGAVRLERDVAGIVGIVVKGGRYGLRDAFLRSTQICLVMNMEEEEWDELQSVQNGEDVQWKLDSNERERARAMVRDSR